MVVHDFSHSMQKNLHSDVNRVHFRKSRVAKPTLPTKEKNTYEPTIAIMQCTNADNHPILIIFIMSILNLKSCIIMLLQKHRRFKVILQKLLTLILICHVLLQPMVHTILTTTTTTRTTLSVKHHHVNIRKIVQMKYCYIPNLLQQLDLKQKKPDTNQKQNLQPHTNKIHTNVMILNNQPTSNDCRISLACQVSLGSCRSVRCIVYDTTINSGSGTYD